MSGDLKDVTLPATQQVWGASAEGNRKAQGCGQQDEAAGGRSSSTHSTRILLEDRLHEWSIFMESLVCS